MPDQEHQKARLIAFYLPQYHPTPENDSWWGPGFTEWTNVGRARRYFRGHKQPRVPADLGYYDLRVAETREHQARLARECGVTGFSYWHYWFGHGRRLLERPFNEVLHSKTPDLPFCLTWANHSWSGVWDGNPDRMLVTQEYPGAEDEAAHFNWALTAFRDERYIRVEGKPLFGVFKPHDMPSTTDFIAHWQRLAVEAGLPGIYFFAISTSYHAGIDIWRNPILDPFDAVTQLAPQDYILTAAGRSKWEIPKRIFHRDFGSQLPGLSKHLGKPRRLDYRDVVEKALRDMPDSPRFLPTVIPNWDNTPRSGHRGVIYEYSTPKLFEKSLRDAVARVQGYPAEKAIVFLKAWNEWAEGNYVEPDLEWGHGYLDAIANVMQPDRQGQHRLSNG